MIMTRLKIIFLVNKTNVINSMNSPCNDNDSAQNYILGEQKECGQ